MATPFEKYFYHGSLHAYNSLFTLIMGDLKIKTERGLMAIPLSMANGRRNDLNKNQPSNVIPFATTAFGAITINKQATTSYQMKQATVTARAKQRIPIILEMEYNVRTKKLGEMLQVIEQIYSVFTPSIDVILEDNDSLRQSQNIKIKLMSHQLQDSWEGDGTSPVHVDCGFNFEVHGFIYGRDLWVSGGNPPDPDGPLINEVIIKMSPDMDTPWTQLTDWFTVDEDGVHHPGDA